MRHPLAILAVAALLGAPAPGLAANGYAVPTTPTLGDVEAAETALADLWTRVPYTARHVMFVSRKASVYGDYEPRPSAVFAPGEALVTYLEPVGYAWKTLSPGTYGFGVAIDFEILTRAGKVLGGQKAFQTVELSSRYRNREFFVSLTLTVDGLAPGDYVLAYTLHDTAGGKATRVEQPFAIKAS